ncbi:MAG: CHC2 zinc finger domain-containing protein [Culicoidibacterales bacterium]
MKASVTRYTEKNFDELGNLHSIVHHFNLNDKVEFYLYQTSQGLDIPRTKGNIGIYQFLNSDFKSAIVDMIRNNTTEIEFEVELDQVVTDFKPYDKHAFVEATGDINCYNVLKISNAAILRNRDSKFYLKFPTDEKEQYKTDKHQSFQFSTPYLAKKVVNQFLIEQINTKLDMVALAETEIVLKKTGRSYCGISPFRDERTPSFHVYPETNTWYDYGASEGGNAITFLQKKYNYNFNQALECAYEYSKNSGFERKIELNVEVEKRKYDEVAIKDVLNIYQSATRLGSSEVPSHKAIKYMEQRNISKQTCDFFELSFLDGSVLPKIKDIPDLIPKILESGLAHYREDGFVRFKMDERASFPIHNPEGEIVAYNGRQLVENKKTPKYLLTSNSIVFKKSDVLFNYHRAVDEAKKMNCLVVTEGVFDVMRCHDVGIKNSVSLLGSSISDKHIELFKNLNVPIVLALDNDEAGKKAIKTISERLKEEDIQFLVHEIQHGKDLDDALQDSEQLKSFTEMLSFFNQATQVEEKKKEEFIR